MTLLRRIWQSPWPVRLCCLALGGTFLAAGALKLMEPRAFAALISRYGLVPDPLLVPAALGLPALEVVAGAGLIFGRRWGLALVTALLGLFLWVLWFGVLHNLDIDCGCFSISEQAEHGSLRQAFYRDLLMLAAVAFLWLRRLRPAPSPVSFTTNKERP